VPQLVGVHTGAGPTQRAWQRGGRRPQDCSPARPGIVAEPGALLGLGVGRLAARGPRLRRSSDTAGENSAREIEAEILLTISWACGPRKMTCSRSWCSVLAAGLNFRRRAASMSTA
jgi:hypothetical protein